MPNISQQPMWIVYISEKGIPHYQLWTDLVEVGTLIDPYSGEDMEAIGWTDEYPDDFQDGENNG